MKITFDDKKLEKIANNDRLRLREFGKLRSEKLRLRLAQLNYALNLEMLRIQPGKYHELSGNRKGQWACDLDQPYRLVFTPLQNPIPVKSNGQFDWRKITEVKILEIINYP